MSHRFRWMPVLGAACIAIASWAPVAPAEPTSEAFQASEPDALTLETVLWPEFQVGQHAVIKQTLRESKRGNQLVTNLVDVEIIEKINDTFVIRWQIRPFDIPEGADPATRAALESPLPPIEILFEEGVGVVGVRHWKDTREKFLALAMKLGLATPEADGTPTDPEKMANIIDMMRRTMMNTREAAEAILLKRIRGYFDGAYHPVPPGERHEEEGQIPWPLAKPGQPVTVPIIQSISVEQQSEPATHYTCTIQMRIDRGRASDVLREFVTTLVPEMADPQTSTDEDRAQFERLLNEMSIERTLTWTLDLSIGWPSAVSSTSKIRLLDDVQIEESTWTLIEGPTMTPADETDQTADAPKTDAAPTQLDTP